MLGQQQARVIYNGNTNVLFTLDHTIQTIFTIELLMTMMTPGFSTTILSLGSGSAFLLFLLNRYLPSRNASNIPRASYGHENSVAVAILNPRRQNLFQHRITIEIPAAKLKHGLDNDEILARFTQGFFGGWIFSPERWFFHLTGLSVTNLDGKYPYLAIYW